MTCNSEHVGVRDDIVSIRVCTGCETRIGASPAPHVQDLLDPLGASGKIGGPVGQGFFGCLCYVSWCEAPLRLLTDEELTVYLVGGMPAVDYLIRHGER